MTVLSVGTFFSGIDVPAHALIDLVGKDNVRLVFGVEKSNICRHILENTLKPEVLLRDIKHLEKVTKLPWVDILWLSPPCLDFSANGKQKGVLGTSGGLIWDAIQYLMVTQATIVVLEQVPGALRRRHKQLWKDVLNTLKQLGYTVFKNILDAQFFKTPQGRRRFFLVCIHSSAGADAINNFTWPTGTKHSAMVDVESFLDAKLPTESCRTLPKKSLTSKSRERTLVKKAIKKILKKNGNPSQAIVDVGCSHKFATHRLGGFPTMTRTRCSGHNYWAIARGRKVNTRELCRGMGLHPKLIPWKKLKVSDAAFGACLGNSVSFGCARAILKSVLRILQRGRR